MKLALVEKINSRQRVRHRKASLMLAVYELYKASREKLSRVEAVARNRHVKRDRR